MDTFVKRALFIEAVGTAGFIAFGLIYGSASGDWGALGAGGFVGGLVMAITAAIPLSERLFPSDDS